MLNNMLFWSIIGIAHTEPNPNPGPWHKRRNEAWDRVQYIIKAASIERAYELFDATVGHNYFEGFCDAVRRILPQELHPDIVADTNENVWKIPTYGRDQNTVKLDPKQHGDDLRHISN